MIDKKTTAKAVKKTVKKSVAHVLSKLQVPHFDQKGEAKENVELAESIFGQQASPNLIAQTVRVHFINKRRGLASTKTRGEVSGSTRKIYRQKGTGRARHGDIKAPVFVGGGIVFGPTKREFSARVTQKMRQKALRGVLSQKVKAGKLQVLSGLDKMSGKTKEMAALFKKTGILNKSLVLVVDPKMQNVVRSARNIAHITVIPASILSTVDVVKNEYVIFSSEALKIFKV